MRALVLRILSMAVTFAAGFVTALVVSAPPAGPLGVYTVPMGTITVEHDGTARYVQTVPYLPGACDVDDTNATTGERHRPYYACAPLHAPDGATVEWLTADDGSATYGRSPLTFDPDLWGFTERAPITTE